MFFPLTLKNHIKDQLSMLKIFNYMFSSKNYIRNAWKSEVIEN